MVLKTHSQELASDRRTRTWEKEDDGEEEGGDAGTGVWVEPAECESCSHALHPSSLSMSPQGACSWRPCLQDPPVPSRPLSLPCLPFTSSLSLPSSLSPLFSFHGYLFSLQQSKFLTPLGRQQSLYSRPPPHTLPFPSLQPVSERCSRLQAYPSCWHPAGVARAPRLPDLSSKWTL